MTHLTPDEARVLGVLIEKAFTTPEQYPLTLNAIVSGCNQKSNRDPVVSLSDDAAFDAVEGLRGKGLVVQVDQMGARVSKYRHQAAERLHVGSAFLAILTELMLRGPQTLGELRGRASRMVPIESLERAAELVRSLAEREDPFVRQISPSPGSRAVRYEQLICPDLHPVDRASATDAGAPPAPSAPGPAAPASAGLTDRVAALEAEVATLRAAVRRMATALGEPDPLG